MSARLIGHKGALAGREVVLSPDAECVIGRAPSATVQVDDDLVSRKHCRIFFEGGYYVLEDLQSKNGTWVNGERVSSTPLFDGDVVTIGRQQLRFKLDGDVNGRPTPVLRDVSTDRFSTEFKERVPERAASQFGVAAAKGRGEHSVPELERYLSAVCRIIDVVNREESLPNLFARIMDHVMEVTQAERGYLFSGNELGGPLTPQVIRQSSELPEWLRNTFSRSMVRECYKTGYSILRADPLGQETDPSQSIMSQRIQSLMCVPMRCEEGTVGVIYVDKLTSRKKFDRHDLRVLSAIANEAGIAVRRAQLARQVETLFSDAIRALVSIIELKDQYTRTHSERVTEVAMCLGELLGLSASQLRDLRLSGLLHDLGKVGTPADVLKKPRKLTDSEYESVKLHPAYSARIVASIEGGESILAAVRHHHERWDGAGYPDGLAGEGIPLLARILAIADAFDSMFGGRPYRGPLAEEEVLAEIERCAGTQFDPHCASEFVKAFRSEPRFRAKIRAAYTEAPSQASASQVTLPARKQPDPAGSDA